MKSQTPGAWDRFIHIYSPLVYSWCRRSGLDGEGAQDVSSEVLNTVFSKLDQFEPGRFRSWLRSIVRTKIVDYVREKGSHRVGVGGDLNLEQLVMTPAPESLDEDEFQDAREISFIYIQAVDLIKDEFPHHYWEIFEAYVIREKSPVEIADRFGVSRDLVYQVKRRVLARLRQELDGLM
ncbi:MAG: sigma-70 family RNA polymerase sigma factor [Planctomycetota bacterium]